MPGRAGAGPARDSGRAPLNATGPAERPGGEAPLPLRLKLGFALGDHTVNVSLAALSLYYLFFLTEIAALRPALASLVLLAGRFVDAVTDPAMGRVSDLTRWRRGRRRPYFLIGALPFGVSFMFLWREIAIDDQMVRFGFYAGAYILHTLFATILAVPYMALLPELALGYGERTSMNIFRSGAAVLGVLLAAVAIRPLVQAFGGGAAGFARTGVVLGVWLALPWAVVYGVTWERPEFSRPARASFLAGLKQTARHGTYRRLVGLFLSSRIAVDLIGAIFIFYFYYWLRRPGDFPIAMGVMFVAVLASLPFWLRVSRGADKRAIFIFGVFWWIGIQLVLLAMTPEWPRWSMFAVAGGAGFGYAVVALMPWSMLGDVIDEDELVTGERREGVYAGLFTFLRKLGGATGVAVAGIVLDLAGFVRGQEQSATAQLAIRGLTALVPALFLLLAAVIAWSYPLSRRRHAEILLCLAERDLPAPGAVAAAPRGGGRS